MRRGGRGDHRCVPIDPSARPGDVAAPQAILAEQAPARRDAEIASGSAQIDQLPRGARPAADAGAAAYGTSIPPAAPRISTGCWIRLG